MNFVKKIMIWGLFLFGAVFQGSDHQSCMSNYQLQRYIAMSFVFAYNPDKKIEAEAFLETVAKNHADFIETKEEHDTALKVEHGLKCIAAGSFAIVVDALSKQQTPVASVVIGSSAFALAQIIHDENESKRKRMNRLSFFQESLAPQEVALIRYVSASRDSNSPY